MKLTIEGTSDEIKEALQAISGSKERKNQDIRVPFTPIPSEKMTTADGQ